METELSPRIKHAWLRVLLFIIVYFIFLTAFGILGFAVKTFFDKKILLDSLENVAQALQSVNDNMLDFHIFSMPFSFVGSVAAVFIFRKLIDRRSFTSLGFQVAGWAKQLSYGFLAGFTVIAIGYFILYFTGYVSVTHIQFDGVSFVGLFCFFILVAAHEELVFRGYVLNNLLGSYNKWISLFISSLIFALVHISNPNMGYLPIINLFLAGVIFGIYYMHKKDLWFPIGMHLTWNFSQGPVFGFEVSGLKLDSFITQHISGNQLITGGEFGFEGSILCTVFSVVFIFFLHFKLSKPITVPKNYC